MRRRASSRRWAFGEPIEARRADPRAVRRRAVRVVEHALREVAPCRFAARDLAPPLVVLEVVLVAAGAKARLDVKRLRMRAEWLFAHREDAVRGDRHRAGETRALLGPHDPLDGGDDADLRGE